MTKITQIEDRGATVAWCPLADYGDIIAVGTKDSGGTGFEDTGGDLEIYDLSISSADASGPKLLGSTKTTSRFASIGWTGTANNSMGLIAGGMVDGTVHVWNPLAVQGQTSPLVASITRHAAGPVKALQFNRLQPTQLVTGGCDGQVLVVNLENPEHPQVAAPSPAHKQSAEITSVAWNTQVAHIVASAAGDGSVVVWDLKSQKPWCELRCETAGQAVTDLCWNPSQGLHLLTASGDDRNPVLKVWDLRTSTSMPLASLSGHSMGILSADWCPHDDTLLVSCGKDNRTILWDLFTLQPIADIPNDSVVQTYRSQEEAPSLFGAGGPSNVGGLASSHQRRYSVKWSPVRRGVISTCALDRKVQVHSMIGLATKSGRPPKWLKPSSSVSCAFGGSVVSCGLSDSKVVKIHSVVEQPELVQASQAFEAALATTTVTDFCRDMAHWRKSEPYESQMWGFMQVIFEANARQQLLEQLGFHPNEIAQKAMEYTEDVGVNGIDKLSLDDRSNSSKVTGVMSKMTEDTIRKALLVGNFEAAVECCFRTGNLADALLLASCGGAELWTKAQERYFASEAPKRPFLSVVGAVIHNQLEDLVVQSATSRWQETLAILSTYGQSEEFPALCIALGDRLEAAGDARSASLCYLCSLSLGHSVKFWRSQLEAANQIRGSLDFLALHDFVVKVTVFLKASGPQAELDPDIAELCSKYASVLAEQGLFVTAAKYANGSSYDSKVLRDRLYRSRESQNCLAVLGAAPEFPFSATTAPARTSSHDRQDSTHTRKQQQQTATIATQPEPSQFQPAAAESLELPAGWIALQDPTTGRTYYANQISGESTWDLPQPVPNQAASYEYSSVSSAPTSAQHQALSNPAQQKTIEAVDSTPSRLASKYGDGFVTSASHPELANQYGNLGTSNPYTGATRPGTASVTAISKAPVSATYDPNNAPELSPEHNPIKECLVGVLGSLSSTSLSPTDKRQLSESEKGVAVLLKRLARGDIEQSVVAKVSAMVDALNNRDYATATWVQTSLVNNDWRDNKDWLKGIKCLVLLTAKKL